MARESEAPFKYHITQSLKNIGIGQMGQKFIEEISKSGVGIMKQFYCVDKTAVKRLSFSTIKIPGKSGGTKTQAILHLEYKWRLRTRYRAVQKKGESNAFKWHRCNIGSNPEYQKARRGRVRPNNMLSYLIIKGIGKAPIWPEEVITITGQDYQELSQGEVAKGRAKKTAKTAKIDLDELEALILNEDFGLKSKSFKW